jgi:hypothetical protein
MEYVMKIANIDGIITSNLHAFAFIRPTDF